MTRKEVTAREGLDAAEMKPRFEALEKAGFLAVRLGMARGLRCNIYSTKRAALFMDREFEQMQPDRRYACSRTILSCFRGRFRRAWAAASVDRSYASHVGYRTLYLDDEGFRELAPVFEAALAHQQEIQAASLLRLGAVGGSPVPATAALFLFESPAEDAWAAGPSRLINAESEALALESLERRLLTARTLMGLMGLCLSGLRRGTLDNRSDSHVSWAPLLLDGGGFWELEHSLVSTRSSVDEVEQKSLARIGRTGEMPIPVTVGFVSFQSPNGSKSPGDEPR